MTAALVTVCGALVTVLVLSLTGHVLRERAREIQPGPPVVAPAGAPAPQQPQPGTDPLARGGQITDDVLDESREIGLFTVLGLALLSVAIGWLFAGRMLRPLGALAATVREVTAVSLSRRRIGASGPRDELTELADAFDAMLDRLDVAFQQQSRFVSDASHELRTPLALMRAELDVMAGAPDGRGLERLSAAVDRAEALLASLLTLSRAEVLRASEPVDLADVAGEVVTATRGTESLRLSLSLSPASVVGDPPLLERLVANLVENAVRYNAPGGRLSVSTTLAGGAAAVVVANDGAVIPGDELERLTDRFHRGAVTQDGHGLGLAVVDAVARAHDGALELVAPAAGGLVATVTFPAERTVDREPVGKS